MNQRPRTTSKAELAKMWSMGRWLLLGVPILAVIAVFVVQMQLGGFAPATPTSTSEITNPAVELPSTANLKPTVLAPEPVSEFAASLPPGTKPHVTQTPIPDSLPPEEVIPIPDLQTPSLPPILRSEN